jgi:hypothetical protein
VSYFSSPYFASNYIFRGLGQNSVPTAAVFRTRPGSDLTTNPLPPSYVYPYRDLDRPAKLLAELGDFWATVYADSLPAIWASQRAQLEAQSVQNLFETHAVASRLTTPVGHADRWRQLTILASDLVSDLAVARYGEGFVYGGDPPLAYGLAAPRPLYSFALPTGLLSAPLIVNRLAGPSVVWHEGIDYVLNFELGFIQFLANPFEAGFATRDVYRDEATPVDVEAGLWLFGAQFDQEFLYRHHGYVLGIQLDSSEPYRDFINALYDSLVDGGHYLALASAVSAVADAPLVRGEQETVYDVLTDAHGLLILTDLDVYRFHADAEALVEPGDVVRRGDPLTNVVQIHEFHQGTVPASLEALTLGRSFLSAGFRDGLTFENRVLALTITEDGGVRQARFPLGGWADDVAKFWADVEEAGVEAGETFGDLLAAQPDGAPTEINPLEFLVANVLRNNAFVVELRPGKFGPNALPLKSLRFLRRLIPPHTAMIVLIQLEASDEPIIMEGPGSEDAPGYEEVVAAYSAGEPFLETLSTSGLTETAQLTYVDGVCV